MFQVIAYYKFVNISDSEEFCRRHKKFCQSLGFKGRVYVSKEGINGTLAGSTENIEKYKKELCLIPGFENTEFKTHAYTAIPFDRLMVKTRPEIVALKAKEDVDSQNHTGKFLTPGEWKKTLESDEDYLLLDVRNDYETAIGHFEEAILPPLANFYDFPKWLEENPIPKEKKVLMYCTGGIRCEKFSAFMKEKGFKDVNQLHGGILNYAEEENGAHFKGKCFVFDDRLAVKVNPSEDTPISRCAISGVACDTYINCANMTCNKLFLCSKESAIDMSGCCSEECKKSEHRRPLDIEKLYIPFRRRHKVFSQNNMY